MNDIYTFRKQTLAPESNAQTYCARTHIIHHSMNQRPEAIIVVMNGKGKAASEVASTPISHNAHRRV